jgi:hypothetical protein
MSASRRKLGDVYRISLADGNLGFMQHIANDATQLGSGVVLVLRKIYPPGAAFAFEKESARDGFLHMFFSRLVRHCISGSIFTGRSLSFMSRFR